MIAPSALANATKKYANPRSHKIIALWELGVSLIMGILSWWLWTHYAIIWIEYPVADEHITALIYRLDPQVASFLVLGWGLLFFLVSDALRRIYFIQKYKDLCLFSASHYS